MKTIIALCLILCAVGCVSPVRLIGHSDGMTVCPSDIEIHFELPEARDGIFLNGRLANRTGTRYWCKVPVLWESTPIVITHVQNGQVETLLTFTLHAYKGESMTNPDMKKTLFINSPPDGAVFFAK